MVFAKAPIIDDFFLKDIDRKMKIIRPKFDRTFKDGRENIRRENG